MTFRHNQAKPRRPERKFTALALTLLALASAHADSQPAFPRRFSFGSGNAIPGYVQVTPETVYTKQTGYGFEPGTGGMTNVHAGAIPSPTGLAASENPFLFSCALPEGNYTVTATFGHPLQASTNTLKAESRRLMLERVVTAPGQFQTRSVTVNLRTPSLPGGGKVHLKAREKGVLHWDDKLTLEFNGARPALRTLEIAPATNAITVFLLGDSTVTDQPEEPWNSWGQMLTRFFKPGVAVANHAESGESLKGSLGALRVEKVLTSLRSGDYVFVQFGHNDQKDRATNALELYKANLKKLVADVRARGATPVLVTSMERTAGVDRPTLKEYPPTVRDVAKEESCPLIDLNVMSLAFYRALGPDLKRAFQDGTHHNAYGSYELAKCVVQGIIQAALPLASHITDDFKSFDPAHPDPLSTFEIPASPGRSDVKPDGN
jgi:lysophospholipase L1-like esterase